MCRLNDIEHVLDGTVEQLCFNFTLKIYLYTFKITMNSIVKHAVPLTSLKRDSDLYTKSSDCRFVNDDFKGSIFTPQRGSWRQKNKSQFCMQITWLDCLYFFKRTQYFLFDGTYFGGIGNSILIDEMQQLYNQKFCC